MKFKYLLFLAVSIFVASAGAYADKLDSNGILRSDDGKILRMDQFKAMSACPKGTHVPTIREVAKLHQAHGAKGILEFNQVDPHNVPAGYEKVNAVNQIMIKDEMGRDILHFDKEKNYDVFYFNREGSNFLGRISEQELWNVWFWSASAASWDSYQTWCDDFVWRRWFWENGAVLCVADQ